ncbi:MAG: FkbM family methyltransferase [Verrucomicrobia bacterium]|nr:FkbM family methyltransferase [Verrucomicrobiota bacterium]
MFWTIVDRDTLAQRQQELEFYRSCLAGLRDGDLIFDVGANTGYKTDIFLRLGARVLAIEPDASNQTLLERRFLTHRIAKRPVTIVNEAVSDRTGSETLWIYRPGDAHNTLSRKWVDSLTAPKREASETIAFNQTVTVSTTTFDKLIDTYGRPFFVKIDAEGYELKALMGLTQAVPFLSFEVNLPEFRQEGVACIDRLSQLDGEAQFNFIVGERYVFALNEWAESRGFREILECCTYRSIEVFCNSPAAAMCVKTG